MSKKFFIKQYSFEQYNHGGVGYSDIEKILEANNYTTIEFPYHNNNGIKAKLWRFIFLYRTLNSIPAQAEVVFLFPVYARIIQYLIHKLSKRKNIKLVCIIGDIDGIKDDDPKKLEQEISELKKFKYFIIHNQGMADWLLKHLGPVQYSMLQFFDFLTPPSTTIRKKTNTIAFAGNLDKSTFVHQLHLITKNQPALHFHILGPTEKPVITNNQVSYDGIFPPYQIPNIIKGSFGLIWDGPNPEQMEGPFATYMPYMTHHKLSLYILSGLPIIAANISASGKLVTQYKIGITINSLHQLQEVIDNISHEEYEIMQNNIRLLAQQISQGNSLQQALKAL